MEDEVLPLYEGQGVTFLPIYSAADSDRGGGLLEEVGFHLPVLVDPDSEVFRAYRVAAKVFPLNVVIDRDGRIAHLDNESGVDAAIAAIDAVLAR